MSKIFSASDNETVKRSVCLFREYHGLYEDDYEGIFYWDPETGQFGADYWSTAWAGGGCRKEEQFRYGTSDVYSGNIPEDYRNRILKGLQDIIIENREYHLGEIRKYYSGYDRYSYQKESFSKFMKECGENFECAVRSIDSIPFLLYYIPECTSKSYKNDKETLKFALAGGNLPETVARTCGTDLVPKRERRVSTEGMTGFTGKIISVRMTEVFGGCRTRFAERVGIELDSGKTAWFNAPKGMDPSIGETVTVWTREFKEYENSFSLKRAVFK